MNLSKALLHSLLRRIADIPPMKLHETLRREIMDSLRVENDKETFTVTWVNKGKEMSRKYPVGYFLFYVRGDRPEDGPADRTVYETNDRHLAEITNEICDGETNLSPDTDAETRKSARMFEIRYVWALIISVAYLVSGHASPLAPAFCYLVFFVLFEQSVITWIVPALIGTILLQFVHLHFTSYLGLIVLMLAEMKSPKTRISHFALLVTVMAYFVAGLFWQDIEVAHFREFWWFLPVGFLFPVSTLFTGLNLRVSTYVIPLVAVGIILDGWLLFGIILLLISGAGLFAVGARTYAPGVSRGAKR
ncbi:MAG: hypothetical protein A4E61_00069 [Syntrophorhabdus sp. PtaB.Bin184]|jgi:hypothetical protein|nr:MAG: hypothetical protein A4E61_00069 [Syntrophorhabdus sp. PtaB.Bin184]